MAVLSPCFARQTHTVFIFNAKGENIENLGLKTETTPLRLFLFISKEASLLEIKLVGKWDCGVLGLGAQ